MSQAADESIQVEPIADMNPLAPWRSQCHAQKEIKGSQARSADYGGV